MDSLQRSYYDILKVKPDASDEDVKRAYRLLVKLYHPDRNPQKTKEAAARLQLVNEAYAKLKTKKNRLRYNSLLQGQGRLPGDSPRAANNDNGLSEQSPAWFKTIATFLRPLHTHKSE